MPLTGPDEIFSQLELCTYRGAAFFVDSSSIEGGRKDSKKEFVNSDVQSIEDLGLKSRIFTLSGSITARYDVEGNVVSTYKNNRDALLAALEKGGTGVLIHPFFGKLEKIVARTYTLDETMTDLGDAKISITFEFSNADDSGQPVSTFNTPSLVAEKQLKVETSTIDSITGTFFTFGSAGGIGADAAAKLGEMANFLNKAARTVVRAGSVITKRFNELQRDITDFQDSVNTLIGLPNQMAVEMANLIRGLDGIFSNVIDSYSAMQDMFDMGALDIPFEGTQTSLSLKRQDNRNIINNSVKSFALSASYTSASQLTFNTIEEIETVAQQLEDQYAILQASDLAKDVIDSLTVQRADLVTLFGQQKLTARQTVSTRTTLTTFRLLAYKFYGTSEDGESLAELNGKQTMEIIGDVEVLSP